MCMKNNFEVSSCMKCAKFKAEGWSMDVSSFTYLCLWEQCNLCKHFVCMNLSLQEREMSLNTIKNQRKNELRSAKKNQDINQCESSTIELYLKLNRNNLAEDFWRQFVDRHFHITIEVCISLNLRPNLSNTIADISKRGGWFDTKVQNYPEK